MLYTFYSHTVYKNIMTSVYVQPILPLMPVSESVCTEWMSHDSLHPAMLHGMTEML